jgi:hypothetical protein
VTGNSVSATVLKYPEKGVKSVVGGILRPLLAGALAIGPYSTPAHADPPPPHHMNLPKPTPRGGDALPWTVAGSSSAITATTVAVIGDSVARDYAYYLARRLGTHGVRVVDGALSGCPAGTLPFFSALHGVIKPLRGGDCPRLVAAKLRVLVRDYAPKLVLWHSITEIWGIGDPGSAGRVPSGSAEWARRVMAQWDDTLRRVTTGGAQVVVILPLWYEHSAPVRLDAPGPSVEKLRDLYVRWAARHKVPVVDVAPLVCPAGPPCRAVNGLDFRPDTTHYDDPGGERVAAYLTAHVPALARLAAR